MSDDKVLLFRNIIINKSVRLCCGPRKKKSKRHQAKNVESINHSEECYNVRRHTGTLIPRVKLPLPWQLICIVILTERMRREGAIGAEEINVTAPMKPGPTSIVTQAALSAWSCW
jgi:hypothetical protein